MKKIFTTKRNNRVQPFDFIVRNSNTSTYGLKSLIILGPKVWNLLPGNVKSETSFTKFKKYVKFWSGPTCKCNLCKSVQNLQI